MRAPGGGASCLGLGRPASGALPPPTTRPFGCAAGAHYPLAVGAGSAGVGTRHRPHSARSCVLAWRAVGAAQGRPGGGALAWVWGVRGRALSQPRPLVLSGVRPGPTTHWLRVRGLQAWGPITNPTARALTSWLCALGGQHEGARGGRLLSGRGGMGKGPLPPPTFRPFGVVAGARFPLAVVAVCGPWGPALLGTFCCAAVCCVLCALPGFAPSGGRCGSAPVLRAVVVAGGVPLCRASWPRVGAPHPVRSRRSRCSGRLFCRRVAFPPPPGGLAPPALLGGCAGQAEAGR